MSEEQGNNSENLKNKEFKDKDDFFHWLSETYWETLEGNGWIEKTNERNFINPTIQGNTVIFQIIRDIAGWGGTSKNVIFYKTNFDNSNLRFSSFYENCIFINCTFEGANFRGEVNFIKNYYKGQTKFFGCDFSDKVTIVNENFDDGSAFIFEKCNFKKRVKYNGSTFDSLEFDGCTFEAELNFINNNFKSQAKFSGCNFSSEVTTVNENFDDGSALIFEKCNFKKRIKCNGSTFDALFFIGCTFETEVNFINNNFKGQTKFSGCDFSNKVTIVNQKFNSGSEIVFHRCNFKKRVKCNGSTFGTLKFDGCTFDEYLNFINNNFKDQIKFSGCDFSNKVTVYNEEADSDDAFIFEKCNFKERVKCNDSTFDTLKFSGCTFDEYLDLTSIYFKKKLTLEFSRVKDLFFNYIDKNSKFENFSFKGIAVGKYIFYEETEVTDAANHQTFTVLKHNAIKSNDSIRAIEFHRQEMDKHLSELACFKWSVDYLKKLFNFLKNSIKSFFSFVGRLANIIILLFEKGISNYGTSFFRVLFWIVVGNFLVTFYPNYYDVITFLEFSEIMGYLANDFFESIYIFKKDMIGITDILRFFFNSILIYELQKSLRKFSRKF